MMTTISRRRFLIVVVLTVAADGVTKVIAVTTLWMIRSTWGSIDLRVIYNARIRRPSADVVRFEHFMELVPAIC